MLKPMAIVGKRLTHTAQWAPVVKEVRDESATRAFARTRLILLGGQQSSLDTL